MSYNHENCVMKKVRNFDTDSIASVSENAKS